MRILKFFIVFIVIFISSCTNTKYIEVPVETIKNNYINTILKDTVIIKDSIDRWLKGDTILITKYKLVYKTLHIYDTIIKTDTVSKIVYINKIVTINELKDYLKILIYIGIFTVIFTIFVLYKKFRL